MQLHWQRSVNRCNLHGLLCNNHCRRASLLNLVEINCQGAWQAHIDPERTVTVAAYIAVTSVRALDSRDSLESLPALC